MKLILSVLFTLVSANALCQLNPEINNIPVKHATYEPQLVTATLAIGFIDYYQNNYTLPPPFVKSNTSGFAPVTALLEYCVSRHISVAGSFGYDAFTYNFQQAYDQSVRYRTNNTRILSGGFIGYYHFRHLLPVKHFDPFIGVGIAINNIRYSAYPQGDSLVTKIDHSVTPYLKAGTRYYVSDKFSLFGDIGYNKHTIFSLGFSMRLYRNTYLPDQDWDGIPDAVDSCVTVRGIAKYHGCPDTDGDGIPDNLDDCPTQAGLAQFHGCPDSDGDGIPDKEDACPNQRGLVQFHGCPDTDGDGIPDNEDDCPNEAGLTLFRGCPDSDGDGIPDKDDRCPHEAGPAENHGCPVVALTPEKRIILPVSTIQFQTGKYTIAKTSYAALDKVALVLINNPDLGLYIDGYADITGTSKVNKRISMARAVVIKKYLVKKGVNPQMLIAKGHGSRSPVASNHTRAGRAKNRRVAIKLKEQH